MPSSPSPRTRGTGGCLVLLTVLLFPHCTGPEPADTAHGPEAGLTLEQQWHSRTPSAKLGDPYFEQARTLAQQQRDVDPNRILADYQCAAVLYRDAGDLLGQARALNFACLAANNWGRHQQAETLAEQALALRRATGFPFETAQSLNNLALVYLATNQPNRAIPFLQQAQPLWEDAQTPSDAASSLNNLGSCYDQLDQPAQALHYYAAAFDKLSQLDPEASRVGRAYVANNIGVTLNYLGDLPRARASLEHAISLWRELGDGNGEAMSQDNLGWTARLAGDFATAADHHRQALATATYPRRRAAAEHNLGLVYYEQGKTDQARTHFQKACTLRETMAKDVRSLAYSHYALAANAAQAGDADAAQLYQRALETAEMVDDDTALLVGLLANRARHLKNRDAEATMADIRQAVALVEQGRTRMPSGDFRARYLAGKISAYQQRVSLYLAQHEEQPNAGFDAAALFALTAMRARALVEMRLKNGLEPEHSPRQAHREGRIRAKGGVPDPNQCRQWLSQKQAALGPHECLVVYWFDREHGQAWVVDQNRLVTVPLAGAEVVQPLTDQLHRAWRRPPSLGDPAHLSQRLGRLILAPIRQALRGSRILLVQDPSLGAVPFAALPLDGTNRVVDRYEVVVLPTLAEPFWPPPKATPSGADQQAVLFADSVTTRRPDPARALASTVPMLIAGAPESKQTAPVAGTRADSRRPLPFARREAEQIRSVLTDFSTQVWVGPEARRTRFLQDKRVHRARLLHLAVHAVADQEHPDRSGLYLSGSATEPDGFLPLKTIARQQLQADLVVLSGCQTGLGHNLAGEGPLSLARAFLVAGADQVVASQWRVSDEATAALMAAFYQNHMGRDMSPGQALREAQVHLKTQTEWKAPFYWAAFQVYGSAAR